MDSCCCCMVANSVKAIFWTRQEVGHVGDTDERETDLAEHLKAGGRAHGDNVEIRIAKGAWPKDVEIVDCDLVVLVGVKSRFWFTAYAKASTPWLYFDKGYIRERADDKWLRFWRMSVNSHHPIDYLAAAKHDASRAKQLGRAFEFAPWRELSVRPIVIDGGSEKNFKFNGIVPENSTAADVDAHCRRIVERVQKITTRPVIYRPKPSSRGRAPIKGTEWARDRASVDKKDVSYDLDRASCVVTYNGAICWDANRIGVPSIILGGGPARPISSTTLEEINNPRLASDAERQQWLNNLAWCQFEPAEIRSGLCWDIVKKMLAVTPINTPAEACPCSPL